MDKKIPTFSELVTALSKDPQEAFKNDQWNALLNMPPHQSWLKKHPVTKGDYLPVDKTEFLLTYIYQIWRVEVKQVQQLFQSVQVTIRLHARNPLTLEWEWQDGIGACPIQTDAGASASDLGAIKNSAVQIAAPSAESYALKDAAEKFGNIFGKNLNRKDTIQFSGAYNNDQPGANGNGQTNGFTKRYEAAHAIPDPSKLIDPPPPGTTYQPPANGQVAKPVQPATPSFTFNPTEL